MEKAAYVTCEKLCQAGCGIYADRPESCRTFRCQWLRGMLEVDGTVDTDLRPDACGVVFDYQPGTAFGEVFTAWEIEPGASTRGHARSIVEGLRERFLVIVMSPGPAGAGGTGECRLIGPPDLVMRASDTMWSRPTDAGVGRWGSSSVRPSSGSA